MKSVTSEETMQTTVEERKKGHWVKKHRRTGGFTKYKGKDKFGEEHEITVDERYEYIGLYCSECGAVSSDAFINYCSKCGAKMEDCDGK